MKYILYFFMLILSVSMISFGDNELNVDCTYNGFISVVNALINDLNAAVAAYRNAPSSTNCLALKDAANDYLGGVEVFDNSDD